MKPKKAFVPRKIRVTPRVTGYKQAPQTSVYPTKKKPTYKKPWIHKVHITKRVTKYLHPGMSHKTGLGPSYVPPLFYPDPVKLYQATSLELAAKSEPGIERFAYMIFGPKFIGSLALALDPYSKIRWSTAKISSANRLANFSVQLKRSRGYTRVKLIESALNPLITLVPACRGPAVWSKSPLSATVKFPSTDFLGLTGYRADTTIRTRPLDSKYGEFELFVPYLDAPPRNTFWQSYTDTSNGILGCGQIFSGSRAKVVCNGYGPGYTISAADVSAVKVETQAIANSLMLKHGIGMVGNCLPTANKFQLAYNIAELKDLPMMLRNTVEFFRHPSDVLSFKGAGNQYLNYKFGWDSTVRAVQKMLELPEKIAKHVNYIISRRNLATNFRYYKTGIESLAAVPTFAYQLQDFETMVKFGIKTSLIWELRCALNLTVKFPNLEIPLLRTELLEKAWGAKPTPSDVYNLVPWSWLLDWFGGIGDYVDTINIINSDRSLFNFGFLTFASKGEISATLDSQTLTQNSWQTLPAARVNETIVNSFNYTGKLSFRYQKRIDISTLAHMKALSRPSTLTGDQLAILGALLTKFTHN